MAGERGDPKTLNFFAEHMEVPIIDHWYETQKSNSSSTLLTFTLLVIDCAGGRRRPGGLSRHRAWAWSRIQATEESSLALSHAPFRAGTCTF